MAAASLGGILLFWLGAPVLGGALVLLGPLLCVLAARHVARSSRDVADAIEDYSSELERAARTDSLTGLSNRRAFDERLASEWQRARRTQTALGLVLCDVDHFKQINDRFGHEAGDHCIVRVASHLRTQVRRPGDLVARWGGEEFAILLPDTTLEGAVVLAERICQALGEAVKTDDSKPVTASLGVAACRPDDGDDPKPLFARADRALYAAKAGGRACVMGAEDEEG